MNYIVYYLDGRKADVSDKPEPSPDIAFLDAGFDEDADKYVYLIPIGGGWHEVNVHDAFTRLNPTPIVRYIISTRGLGVWCRSTTFKRAIEEARHARKRTGIRHAIYSEHEDGDTVSIPGNY